MLFAFLGNLRAAMIVALAIPLSMLFAFSGMLRFGIAASLLSLGAIDFGMIVDSSVVMIENCVRHIAHGDNRRRPMIDVVRDAAVEVRKPTMFGELIIMIVYLPILTLEGIEGKLFRPMALTVIFALVGSMILSLTLMPVLASLLLPRRIDEREPLLMRIAQSALRPGPARSPCTTRRSSSALPPALLFVAFGDDRPESGLRVRAAAFRRRDRHQRRPADRHRSGRLDQVQHADGKGRAGRVPRRGRARLEPHRHGRDRHRPDGHRTDRHVHHAQAARAVEAGAHAGRADRR